MDENSLTPEHKLWFALHLGALSAVLIMFVVIIFGLKDLVRPLLMIFAGGMVISNVWRLVRANEFGVEGRGRWGFLFSALVFGGLLYFLATEWITAN